MSDSQAVAAKPLYLSASSPGKYTLRSPTATRENTSTFSPKAAATVSVSDASVSARIAALHAGTRAQSQAPLLTPVRRHERRGVSPPRGRRLNTHGTLTSGVVSSTTSPSRSHLRPQPVLQRRSSSTNAVISTSPKSISPRISPARSPKRPAKSNSTARKNERGKEDINALFGAVASVAGVTRIYNRPPRPTKTSTLDFEKIPKLSASERSESTKDDIGLPISTKNSQTSSILAEQPLTSSPVLDDRTKGVRNPVSRSQTMPFDIQRQSFNENRTNHGGRVKSQTIPVPTGSTGPRRMQTTSPPKPTLQNQDDYRFNLAVNSLADAMVASSLASSRATSPAKPPTPPHPRRRSRSAAAIHELNSRVDGEILQQPAKPARPMKHTLRKHVSDDDEVVETKRGRKHWMRKHPNMHSEGDRKRWLDKVTESERKRFEGVFAANRGLLIGPGYFVPSPGALSDSTTVGNQVVNVVVRDIWERSRLPADVLREIYDLVCPEEAVVLNREQFVVGLWLIDQRLKGRKLPPKVSSSVWSSVRHTQGIKLRKMGS